MTLYGTDGTEGTHEYVPSRTTYSSMSCACLQSHLVVYTRMYTTFNTTQTLDL